MNPLYKTTPREPTSAEIIYTATVGDIAPRSRKERDNLQKTLKWLGKGGGMGGNPTPLFHCLKAMCTYQGDEQFPFRNSRATVVSANAVREVKTTRKNEIFCPNTHMHAHPSPSLQILKQIPIFNTFLHSPPHPKPPTASSARLRRSRALWQSKAITNASHPQTLPFPPRRPPYRLLSATYAIAPTAQSTAI